MARPIWTGAISLGLIHIPVSLYPAEAPDELDLTMLDKRDFAPVGFKRYNKKTGKEVEWNAIVKGYEYAPDSYVVLSDADFKTANVKATQTIDLIDFVPVEEIPPHYFDKPYYLTPGKRGEKVYALLREALNRSGKAAVAQIVIRVRQHLAMLRVEDDALMLITLRYPSDMRDTKELELDKTSVSATGISEKEIKMALSLIEQSSGEWDPSQYRDSYRDDLMALIERRIAKNQTQVLNTEEPEATESGTAEVIDLMELLKRSLPEMARKRGDKTTGDEESQEKSGAKSTTKTAAKSSAKSKTSAAKRPTPKTTEAPRRRRAA